MRPLHDIAHELYTELRNIIECAGLDSMSIDELDEIHRQLSVYRRREIAPVTRLLQNQHPADDDSQDITEDMCPESMELYMTLQEDEQQCTDDNNTCHMVRDSDAVLPYRDINDMHLIKSEGALEQKIDWKQVSTAASAPELFPEREDMWSSVFYKGAYVGQVQRQQNGTFHARIDTVPASPCRYKTHKVTGFETVHAAVEELVFGRSHHEKDPRKQRSK